MKINCVQILLIGIALVLTTGCDKDEDDNGNSIPQPKGAPAVTTTEATSVTKSAAVLGGEYTSDEAVTAVGICWSTHNNPTMEDNIELGYTTQTKIFYCSLGGLSAGTTYYARAFATNSKGTGYGKVISFTTGQQEAINPDDIKISGFTMQYAFMMDGKQYHLTEGGGIDNYVSEYDVKEGEDEYYKHVAYSSKLMISGSSWTNTEDEHFFIINKGSLQWPHRQDVPFGNFCYFFETGDVQYSKNAVDGVEIIWYDENKTEWSTSLGAGTQNGSTFTITDMKTNPYPYIGDYVKIRALFSCTLYDGKGNSKKVTNGVFLGVFGQW